MCIAAKETMCASATTSSDFNLNLKLSGGNSKNAIHHSLVIPSPRKNLSTFLACSACILFPFLTILFYLLLPVSMCRCSSNHFLWFFCFLKLEELIDVVFPSLSRSSHCFACFVSTVETWIFHFSAFFFTILSLAVKRSSLRISISSFCV